MILIASLGSNVTWGLIHLAREKVEADVDSDSKILPKAASHQEETPGIVKQNTLGYQGLAQPLAIDK